MDIVEFSNNNISNVKNLVVNPLEIKKLNLSNNKIHSCRSLSQFVNVIELNLSHNKIKKVCINKILLFVI
jgi:Leucine-rich repeat (LRR) protein